jgi:hypothetical protein
MLDKNLQGELSEEVQKTKERIGKGDYKKQRDGWLHFSDGRPKQKVRFYIKKLAQALTKYNDLNYSNNRARLLVQFSIGGVEAANQFYREEIYNLLKQAKEQQAKEQEKINAQTIKKN